MNAEVIIRKVVRDTIEGHALLLSKGRCSQGDWEKRSGTGYVQLKIDFADHVAAVIVAKLLLQLPGSEL
jgi:hypothetical protein